MPRRVKFVQPQAAQGTQAARAPPAKKNHPMRLLGLPPPVWRVVYEYCQQASLHGLRYISNTELPYIERYLWLGVFLACLGFAINLIYEVWELWREKPFFITFDSYMTPVWTIPFPAVTICSAIPIKRSVLDIANTKNQTLLFYASLVCSSKNILKMVNHPEYVGNEIYDYLLKASPSCQDMLKVCTFRGHKFNCCEVFEPEITDYGLCFTFNKLPAAQILRKSTYDPYGDREYPADAKFWNPDEGYPVDELHKLKEKIFPKWAQVAGENNGLQIELYQNKSEWQMMCSGGQTGFQVRLTNPADQPVNPKVDERLFLNRETSLMVTPVALGSNPSLQHIPTRVRSCYFAHERHLKYFTLYTYHNCVLECKSLNILNECGCVPLKYPRWNHTRLCSSKKDVICIKIARVKLTSETMDKTNIGPRNPCNCLQGCQEIYYKSTDFYTNFLYTGIDPYWANGTTIGPNSVTRVMVYFKSSQFLGQHRVIRYTDLKFAGTCGGLLSLLLGFSVISAIEVVYAFILRPLNRALMNSYHQRRTDIIMVHPAPQQRQKQDVFYIHGRQTIK